MFSLLNSFFILKEEVGRMKKILSVSMQLFFCFMFLFANGTKEAGKTELLWVYESATPEHEQFLKKDLIDVVNSRANGYKFDIRFDANYDQNIRTAMLAGAGPDLVFTAGPSYVQQFSREKYLFPLDDFAKKYNWNKIIFPVMQELCSFDGHLYALPKTYESMVLFYNKSVFEKNGWKSPKTWDEFENLCKKIKDTGMFPLINGNAGWRPVNEHLVTIFWNHIVGPDKIHQALEGKIKWSDPVFVKATEKMKFFFKEYFDSDYFSYRDEDCLSLLAQGTVAMYPSGTWNFQRINNYFKETKQDWDWVPLPSAAGVAYPLYTLGIGATLSINAKSQNPDAVAELLNTLFTDKNVIVNLNVDWPGEWNLPVNTISQADFRGRIDTRYARCIEEIGKALNSGNYGYTTWTFWPETTNQYLWEAFEKLVLNQISVEEYLKGMDRVFADDLKAGNKPILP